LCFRWAGREIYSGVLFDRGLGAVGRLQPLVDHGPGDIGGGGVGQPVEDVAVQDGHDRKDLPGQVRAAGGRVVVGRVVQRLHADPGDLLGGHAVLVELLQRAAGEHRAGSDRVEPELLVRATGHVVAEDAAGPGVLVGGGEPGDHG